MCLVFVTWFFIVFFFFFKQKTAYEMRISDWSSDVCSSDLLTLDFNGSSNAYQRWRGGMGARTGLDEKVSKARIAASPSNVYYRSLKDDILSGRLRPGLKLTTAFLRSEEHTYELQSLMRISYAVLCLKKKNNKTTKRYR